MQLDTALRKSSGPDSDHILSEPLNIDDFGLHVYRIKRTFRHPISGILHKVGRQNLSSRLATESIEYTKGKGVVGQCWKEKESFTVDCLEEYSHITTKDEWNSLKKKERRGLTWAEYERSKHCGVIHAIPILRGKRLQGCVSADLRFGKYFFKDGTVSHEIGHLVRAMSNRSLRV